MVLYHSYHVIIVNNLNVSKNTNGGMSIKNIR
jgi:hypothetical protein